MHSWYYDKQELKFTPSILDGFDVDKEFEFRKQGARFIIQIGSKMNLKYTTIATAVVYFHRFYMFHSFAKFSKYVMASCCLFFAGKVEETPKKSKDIISFARYFLSDLQFEEFMENPKDEMLTMEKVLLQTIKFDFEVDHPYKYLLKYAKCLKGNKTELEKIVQMAWTFINDSLCTMLCLQWEPEIIAIAFLYLAAKLNKYEIADWNKRLKSHHYWWDVYVEGITIELLEDICHQLLDIYCSESSSSTNEMQDSNSQKTQLNASIFSTGLQTITKDNSLELKHCPADSTFKSEKRQFCPKTEANQTKEKEGILDESFKDSNNFILDDKLWKSLQQIATTIVPKTCHTSIVIHQNILSSSYNLNLSKNVSEFLNCSSSKNNANTKEFSKTIFDPNYLTNVSASYPQELHLSINSTNQLKRFTTTEVRPDIRANEQFCSVPFSEHCYQNRNVQPSDAHHSYISSYNDNNAQEIIGNIPNQQSFDISQHQYEFICKPISAPTEWALSESHPVYYQRPNDDPYKHFNSTSNIDYKFSAGSVPKTYNSPKEYFETISSSSYHKRGLLPTPDEQSQFSNPYSQSFQYPPEISRQSFDYFPYFENKTIRYRNHSLSNVSSSTFSGNAELEHYSMPNIESSQSFHTSRFASCDRNLHFI